jgi:hypothetical protein
MTDVLLARHRIEDAKADRLREWFDELERREDEVVATLRNERMFTESAFVGDGPEDGATYLYVFLEAADMAEARGAADDSDFEIDAEHREVIEDVLVDGGGEEMELLGHFTNPERW